MKRFIKAPLDNVLTVCTAARSRIFLVTNKEAIAFSASCDRCLTKRYLIYGLAATMPSG